MRIICENSKWPILCGPFHTLTFKINTAEKLFLCVLSLCSVLKDKSSTKKKKTQQPLTHTCDRSLTRTFQQIGIIILLFFFASAANFHWSAFTRIVCRSFVYSRSLHLCWIRAALFFTILICRCATHRVEACVVWCRARCMPWIGRRQLIEPPIHFWPLQHNESGSTRYL